MIRLNPVTRLLALPALARFGLLLALVVAVFLAESFTSLLEEALRQDANSGDVFLLLLLQAPEILDLALALGVLIALFFTIQDSRNRGELVILSIAGVRWTKVIHFALLFGVVGGCLSVCVTGYLVPKARYIERISMAQLRADYVLQRITTPASQSSRLTILDTTIIATPASSEDQERGQLFVFQPNITGSWRISKSRDWTVTGPDENGDHRIKLDAVKAYDGSFVQHPPGAISVFSVNNAEMAFRLSDATKAPDFAVQERERILQLSSDPPNRIAKIGARALLVPMAALLALAAVLASGTGLTRFLTLPIAAVLLLFYDILGRTVVADASLTLSPMVLLGLALAVYLAPPLAFVLWRGEAIMKPERARG